MPCYHVPSFHSLCLIARRQRRPVHPAKTLRWQLGIAPLSGGAPSPGCRPTPNASASPWQPRPAGLQVGPSDESTKPPRTTPLSPVAEVSLTILANGDAPPELLTCQTPRGLQAQAPTPPTTAFHSPRVIGLRGPRST